MFILSKILWIQLIQIKEIDKKLLGDLCIQIQAIFQNNSGFLGYDLNDILKEANKTINEKETKKDNKTKIKEAILKAFDIDDLVDTEEITCLSEDILNIIELLED